MLRVVGGWKAGEGSRQGEESCVRKTKRARVRIDKKKCEAGLERCFLRVVEGMVSVREKSKEDKQRKGG